MERKPKQPDVQVLLALNALIEMAKSGQVDSKDLGRKLGDRLQALAKSPEAPPQSKSKSVA